MWRSSTACTAMSPSPSSLGRPLLTHLLTAARSPSQTPFIKIAVFLLADLDPVEEASDSESHQSVFPIKSAALYTDPAGSMDTPLGTASSMFAEPRVEIRVVASAYPTGRM